MHPAQLKLVRHVPVNSASLLLSRAYSNQSYLSMIIGQVNKLFRGSETPYKKPDLVLEQMIKEEKWRIPKVFAKQVFLRDKARKNYVVHNERIRKLENKITGGAYEVKSFQNRF